MGEDDPIQSDVPPIEDVWAKASGGALITDAVDKVTDTMKSASEYITKNPATKSGPLPPSMQDKASDDSIVERIKSEEAKEKKAKAKAEAKKIGSAPGGAVVSAGIAGGTISSIPDPDTTTAADPDLKIPPAKAWTIGDSPEWYDQFTSIERHAMTVRYGVHSPGDDEYWPSTAVADTKKKSEVNGVIITHAIPRRLVHGGFSTWIHSRQVAARVVVEVNEGARLSDVSTMSMDLTRNFATLRDNPRFSLESFFGIHPEAQILKLRGAHAGNSIDMIRWLWAAYNRPEPLKEATRNYESAWEVTEQMLTGLTNKHVFAYASNPRQVLSEMSEALRPRWEKIYYTPVGATAASAVSDIAAGSGGKKLPKKKDEYLRPNGEKYFARQVVTGGASDLTDVQMVTVAREKQINVLLTGAPGTGKTALCEAALTNLQTIECDASTEAADFIGSYVPNGPDSFEWMDGPMLVAAKNGWPLLVDEIAMCDPRVLPVLYSAMDGRGKIHVTANPEIGTVDIAEGFYVIGACNPDVPGAIMSDALLSRFPIQLKVTTDYGMLRKLGIDQEIITVAANLAKQLANGELMRAPQTRELIGYQKMKDTFGKTVAISNFIATSDPSDEKKYVNVVSSAFGISTQAIEI